MSSSRAVLVGCGLSVSVLVGGGCATLLGDFELRGAGGEGGTTSTTTDTTVTTGSTSSGGGQGGGGQGGGGQGGGGQGGGAACDGRPCPVVLATHVDLPWGITVRGGYVYWTVAGDEVGAGKVMRAPTAGGEATTVVSQLMNPDQIFVDDQHVYWTSNIAEGAVERISLVAPSDVPEVVAANQFAPIGLVGDGANIYFTTSDGYVKSHPLGGGSPDGSVVLSPVHPSPSVLSLSGDALFFAEFVADGRVVRQPLGGGPEVILAEHQDHPNAVIVSDWVYFTTTVAHGTVTQVGIDGGPPTVFAADQNQPAGIVADAQYVYWANYGDGTIRRLKKVGGTPETLASGQRSPNGIAVDDAFIYWTNFEVDGTVMKLPK